MATIKATRKQLLRKVSKLQRELGQAQRNLDSANARIAEFSAQKSPEQEYWQDVRDEAEAFAERWNAGEFAGDRDSAIDALQEEIDGAGRVIYTARAQECLRYSDNDGAYFDHCGTEGALDRDGIAWSKLAYFAFYEDVCEQLSSEGINLNDDPPDAPEPATNPAEEERA